MEQTRRFSSITEQVYDQLHRDIMHATLAPGQRMTIRKLAEMYEVSTMPIREALHKLSSEGLVKYDRRGLTVNALTEEEIKQIYEARMRLESLLLVWASDRATAEDIDKLEQLVHDMDLHSKNDRARWMESNYHFHMGMYQLAGSERLLNMIRSLYTSIEPYLFMIETTQDVVDASQNEHHLIVDALKSHDHARLDQLIRSHLQDAADTVLNADSSAGAEKQNETGM
ncbi:GntR family transcriptional regulator [Paenibacillus beijingensis]|uniref:HTH gntR-type domain-containing protein n=1 Tax=Paenibacillus beijingensis TaxID=1126833 RepID=A0A0D5NNF4_9BACL|nr:GntR family transcriptional regulator [Paenibacillus beijingensis]AJY76801.1 hypothetical protein VN24_22325 [Paenibacillus beijingensis]